MEQPNKEDQSWMNEVLEPEQLSVNKKRLPLRHLSKGILIALWALRIYVILMIVFICIDVWNVLH